MKSAFYNVRVVYDPVLQEFNVQSKYKWYSRWTWERTFKECNYSTYEGACRMAIEVAERLSQNKVVYCYR